MNFYARQLYRQVLPRARIGYGDSVCPSVCLSVRPSVWVSRHGTEPSPGEIETSGLHHMTALRLKSLVSNEVILVPLGEEIPLERGHQRGVYRLRNRYFTTIGSSSVKTVADRHRLAANHNKHWRRVLASSSSSSSS